MLHHTMRKRHTCFRAMFCLTLTHSRIKQTSREIFLNVSRVEALSFKSKRQRCQQSQHNLMRDKVNTLYITNFKMSFMFLLKVPI